MQVLSLPAAVTAVTTRVPKWLLCAALGTAALYIYGTWPYSYWKKRGIRGPAMLPLLGDMVRFVRMGGFRRMMLEDMRLFGKVYGTYFMRRPVLVVADPEMLKQVCIKRAENFTDRGTLGNETRPLDKGVLVLKGQEWKRVRSILTPTFSSGKMKAMYPLVEQCVNQLCDSLLKQQGKVVDIKKHFTNFTMDVVASTLFGLQINSQDNPDNEFNRNGKELFSFSFLDWKVWLLFVFPQISVPLFKRFQITLFKQASLDFFEKVISDALKDRQNSDDSNQRHDFLASMVAARREAENQGVKGLTEHEVMAQSLTFFLAGFETTASSMQFMAYFLAWHPDCQDRVYREILEAKQKHDGDLTYECVQSLKYLNQCFDETLRMCPPALFTDRVCTETTVVNGYEIEKGVNVRVPIYSLAHDPDLWEDPETFNPDRFDQDSAESREQIHLIPFGLGPRNCIGMRLAQMEIRKAMAEMLLRLEFRTVPETQPFDKLEFKPAGLLMAKEPIMLGVQLRVPRD